MRELSLDFVDRVLDEFARQHPEIQVDREVHAVYVGFGDAERAGAELVILHRGGAAVGTSLPPSVNIDGVDFEVRTVVSPPFIAQQGPPYPAGCFAAGEGLPGFGTHGWAFYLGAELVSLSNWHVYCPYGNATPRGSKVYIHGDPVARLVKFEPVYFGAINEWDIAFAAVSDPSRLLDRMNSCEGGMERPYPQDFAPAAQSFPSGQFETVGARKPTCAQGHSLGVGYVDVEYRAGVARFRRQLFFSHMSDPGDSGSVVVGRESGLVWGMIFAGNGIQSVANPVYQYNLRRMGTRVASLNKSRPAEFPWFEHRGGEQVAVTGESPLGFPTPGPNGPPPAIQYGSLNPGTVGALTNMRRAHGGVRSEVWRDGNWVRFEANGFKNIWVNVNAPDYFWSEE